MQQSEVLLWFIADNTVLHSVVTMLTLFIWLSFLSYLFFYLCATDCVSVNKDYHIYVSVRCHLRPLNDQFVPIWGLRNSTTTFHTTTRSPWFRVCISACHSQPCNVVLRHGIRSVSHANELPTPSITVRYYSITRRRKDTESNWWEVTGGISHSF